MIDRLKEMLKRHEGFESRMYKCTAGIPTIGYGHNLRTPISEQAGEMILLNDMIVVFNELDSNVPWWEDLPEDAQIVIANMCFNLGYPRLSRFKKFWAALEDRDYEQAAREMEDSVWFHQVKGRARELQDLMRNCHGESKNE